MPRLSKACRRVRCRCCRCRAAPIKDVIEGPARRFEEAGGKLTIEPQLTQRLLEDIDKGGGSDALPLLAFTLEQLYLDYAPDRRACARQL